MVSAMLDSQESLKSYDWFHNQGLCQQQQDIANCGVFTIHNIDCIAKGYEPLAFECAPEMLREKYATAISEEEKQVHRQVFSEMLSRYRKENWDTITRGRASYAATLAILDPLAHIAEDPFQSLPDLSGVTSSPVARFRLFDTTLVVSIKPLVWLYKC